MNYDTIKLLNLEDINIDLTKSHVDKVNGNLECTIVLNNTIKCVNIVEALVYVHMVLLL